MNTLKNLIVTGMLLVVAYGAYVVLQTGPTPPPIGALDPDEPSNGELRPPTVGSGEGVPPARDPNAGDPNAGLGDPAPTGPAGSAAGPGLSGTEIPPYQPPADMKDDATRYEPSPSMPPNQGDSTLAGKFVAGGGANTGPAAGLVPGPGGSGSAGGVVTPPPTAAGPNGPGSASPDGVASFEAVWGAVEKRLANNDLAPALTELSMYFRGTTLTDDQYQRSVSMLDNLAATVIYSRESLLEPPYAVVAGDTLNSIAAQYKVTPEFLAKLNGMPATATLTPGEKLKVLTGPFEAEVDAARKELTMYLGRCYAGRFPVELGPNLPPATGEYEIVERTPGHAYLDKRTAQQFAAGAPENPFGNIWLGLRGDLVTAAHEVGIHSRGQGSGVLDMSSIVVSQQDAEDVYAILSVGSRVRVRR
ncbi:MAG: LysM peptidoglycan-binding domain-containing protein [Pirellulales bacterium]